MVERVLHACSESNAHATFVLEPDRRVDRGRRAYAVLVRRADDARFTRQLRAGVRAVTRSAGRGTLS